MNKMPMPMWIWKMLRRQSFVLLIFAMLLCFTHSVSAFEVPVAQDSSGRPAFVVDTAGKLSPIDLQALNHKVFKINKTSRNEIGVLIVPSLNGEDPADVAHQIFNTWHIGKKDLDNGVLLLIAVNDRKIRLETGKGVGGDLPDIKAKHILDEVVRPRLKEGNFFLGISDGVDAVAGTLSTATLADSGNHAACEFPPGPTLLASTRPFVIGLVIGFFVIVAYRLFLARARQAKTRKRISHVTTSSVTPTPKSPIGLSKVIQPLPRKAAVVHNTIPPRKKIQPTWELNSSIATDRTSYVSPAWKPVPKQTIHSPVSQQKAAEEQQQKAVARRVREKEEADERERRDKREEASRSSYTPAPTSSPSFDSSSSWGSSGGFDGGDFGGGDSGGGGASSDF